MKGVSDGMLSHSRDDLGRALTMRIPEKLMPGSQSFKDTRRADEQMVGVAGLMDDG